MSKRLDFFIYKRTLNKTLAFKGEISSGVAENYVNNK